MEPHWISIKNFLVTSKIQILSMRQLLIKNILKRNFFFFKLLFEGEIIKIRLN